VFGFIPESVFTFIPESRSESSRNPVHLDPGTAFTFARNPHLAHTPSRSQTEVGVSHFAKYPSHPRRYLLASTLTRSLKRTFTGELSNVLGTTKNPASLGLGFGI